jgi:polyketide synthase PksN
VILEEYREQRGEAVKRSLSHPALIVLSARTEEQLHERVKQLLAWIRDWSLCPNASEVWHTGDSPTGAEEPLGQAQDRSLARSLLDNLAYTLQVGREAMEERLALQVGGLSELSEKLGRYLQMPQEGGDWYRGQVKRNDPMGAFAADEDGQKTVAAWMSKGKYEKLLEWWVKGLTIDWKQLYTVGVGQANSLPRRISLPSYPFARERYWIPTTPVFAVPSSGSSKDVGSRHIPTGKAYTPNPNESSGNALGSDKP